MAYKEFARYYDGFNGDADYDALAGRLIALLLENGVANGIVADLGCGTGELTLRLAKAGYDMIGVDASTEMLAVLRAKIGDGVFETPPLLLCQPLQQLDLYGTIRAAVSSFDTLNHLPPDSLYLALRQASLFMEPGGLLLFDVNTPYKHERILAGQSYSAQDEAGRLCNWEGSFDAAQRCIHLDLKGTEEERTLFQERITEYAYTLPEWKKMLAEAGLKLQRHWDGESFAPARGNSQRWLIEAKKA